MADIQEETRTVTMSVNEMIFIQLRDLKEGQRDLSRRMDKLEEKLETSRKEFNGRIDRLETKMDTSTNHEQIAATSNIGIGVAAASSTIFLLYSLLSK